MAIAHSNVIHNINTAGSWKRFCWIAEAYKTSNKDQSIYDRDSLILHIVKVADLHNGCVAIRTGE